MQSDRKAGFAIILIIVIVLSTYVCCSNKLAKEESKSLNLENTLTKTQSESIVNFLESEKLDLEELYLTRTPLGSLYITNEEKRVLYKVVIKNKFNIIKFLNWSDENFYVLNEENIDKKIKDLSK